MHALMSLCHHFIFISAVNWSTNHFSHDTRSIIVLFHVAILDFSGFPASWNVLNVVALVNMHALVSLWRHVIFISVVYWPKNHFFHDTWSIIVFFRVATLDFSGFPASWNVLNADCSCPYSC